MAADEQRRRHRSRGRGRGRRRKPRVLVVVEEKRMDLGGISVYRVLSLNLKHMFAAASSTMEDDGDWALLRPFPRPIAQMETLPRHPELLDLAIVGSDMVVGVSNLKRTLLHDTAGGGDQVSPGPELRHDMPGGTALIPLGRRVYAIGYRPCRTSPSFQALLPPVSGRRRQWSWRSLPTPHRELCSIGSGLLWGWMGAGTHVWVSAPGKGTYSFDTAHPCQPWRKDGEWELPIRGRGLFIPELGLCFGLCPRLFCLCAFDLPATATEPVVRYMWPASFPDECRGMGFITPGSLAYLGNGRFCIAWTMGIEHNEHIEPTRFALLLVAVQVVSNQQSELCIAKRKVRCYNMPTNGQNAYVLQPALA